MPQETAPGEHEFPPSRVQCRPLQIPSLAEYQSRVSRMELAHVAPPSWTPQSLKGGMPLLGDYQGPPASFTAVFLHIAPGSIDSVCI